VVFASDDEPDVKCTATSKKLVESPTDKKLKRAFKHPVEEEN
jgi:hypothetical protein